MSGTLALVPIRGGHGAKTRLADMFSEHERSRLVWHMARRVLTAVERPGLVDHTVVVTYEPELVSRQIGDEAQNKTLLSQSRDRAGLNAALDLGRHWGIEHGYGRMMILSADLPTVDENDIQHLTEHGSSVVIAPDRHGTGTNALALDLDVDNAGAFAFQFGHGSRDRHLEEARREGLEWSIVCRDGLQRDLDTPEDWLALPESTRNELLSVAKQSVMTRNS